MSNALKLENTALGLELGSTRIKAVLIGPDHAVLAAGAHDWENRLEDGYWTYSLDDVWAGVQDAYAKLAEEFADKYGMPLTSVGAMGVSAMMHGYLPFDADGVQLAPFRTWRNTTTGAAAARLTELLGFNIPQRWSVAHLYQAMLNGEAHVKDIAFLTTLAGYVHWRLTGEKVLGVGEASGMFPIDSASCAYDGAMLAKFDALAQDMPWRLADILPRVLRAGEDAGALTAEGARLLDPSGALRPGVPLCPPEGDAGTGMAATDSVAPRTGNVSAGTSVFAMLVLEKPLSKVYPEIDMVTTPAGAPVAMVHCNTCTSDLDAWVKLLGEMAAAAGAPLAKPALYDLFYEKALEGEADCGGLVSYNYYSGEPVTGLAEGRPLMVRRPDARLTLANLARVQLYAAMATLKLGMDILFEGEGVRLDTLLGHGGLFKTPVVGQRLLAGALGVPVAVMETAGEGGPWGMALLAAYMLEKRPGETLEQYLANRVFADAKGTVQRPREEDCAGLVTWCHTFSPSKMWINGLAALQKPYCHLATQYDREIPDEEIDMDFMNLNQAAHGDREHGFIAARLRMPRKVIAGFWRDEDVQERLGSWMRAAVGAAFSRRLKVMRFGDNMREVAVTEGDKVEVQAKLGWQVNTWPVGQLVETMDAVTDGEIDALMDTYRELYDFATDDIETVRYQAREELAMKKMLDAEGCRAFSNTFQDLYGMKQLPGLASQHLMAQGYGYGGEGDWKVAAMTAILKAMSEGQTGGTAFMEDYTYHLEKGREYSLGAHMLEVCPSVAAQRPRIEVHPLGIGDREPPARLVFEGHAGDAIVVSLVDMGGRLRLICQDIHCVEPIMKMPNLPVARVMWRAEPSLTEGVECWITAGGAHHTVLSYDVTAGQMRDWARIMDIEFVHITKDTTVEGLERELFLADLAWKLK